MEKIGFMVLLCASILCLQVKSSAQTQPLNCNASITVYGSPSLTPISPKYNDDGVLEVEAGQGISFRILSKSNPRIYFSPNLKIHTRKDMSYTEINDPTTYVARFDVYVQVGEGQSGWFDLGQCSIEGRTNDNSSTIFFSSDKSGKKLAENGSKLQMGETARRYIVPCRATNKNVLPTLQLISPADLRNDNFTARYEPKFGFILPWDSLSLARTFECVVDEEKVTVEFSEIDFDTHNEPAIWMNESSKTPECSVRRSTDMTVETIACDDPYHCNELTWYYYQNPRPQPNLKVYKCTNCLNISVPLTTEPTKEPMQTMRISCYASGNFKQRDVVRGLDGAYYFGDRLSKTPEATIQAKEISREGSKVTVRVEALRYLYFPVKDASIYFKDGSTELIDKGRMSQFFAQGIHNLEVTVHLYENMDKITFHAFNLNTMKLTNVSVNLASPGYLLRGTQQEN